MPRASSLRAMARSAGPLVTCGGSGEAVCTVVASIMPGPSQDVDSDSGRAVASRGRTGADSSRCRGARGVAIRLRWKRLRSSNPSRGPGQPSQFRTETQLGPGATQRLDHGRSLSADPIPSECVGRKSFRALCGVIRDGGRLCMVNVNELASRFPTWLVARAPGRHNDVGRDAKDPFDAGGVCPAVTLDEGHPAMRRNRGSFGVFELRPRNRHFHEFQNRIRSCSIAVSRSWCPSVAPSKAHVG